MDKKYYALTILLFVFILLQACKKNPASNNSITKDNVVGLYKITDMKQKIGNGQETDIYNELSYCGQHDTYQFKSDGTYLIGGTVSQNTNPPCEDPDDNGTWTLTGNQLSMVSNTGQPNIKYNITAINGKNMMLSISGQNNNGDPETDTYTLTKQ